MERQAAQMRRRLKNREAQRRYPPHLLVLQQLNVGVRHVTQSGRGDGLAARECNDHARASPDLAQDALRRVVIWHGVSAMRQPVSNQASLGTEGPRHGEPDGRQAERLRALEPRASGIGPNRRQVGRATIASKEGFIA